jgi:hypothetical protein
MTSPSQQVFRPASGFAKTWSDKFVGLIATRSKEKLPAGFSYPVGAEAISEALREVSFVDQLELCFTWKDMFWASLYREKLLAQGAIEVVDVGFFRGWTIRVASVPRSHAHVARELVIAKALPLLALALRQVTEAPGHFHWAASFDLSTSSLVTDAASSPMGRGSTRRFRGSTRPHRR